MRTPVNSRPRGFALVAAHALVILVSAARAQTAAGAGAGEVQQLQAFVVTGSNIPSTETAEEATAAPLVVYDRKAIGRSGAQTLTELLQNSTVSNGGAVPASNNATGWTPSASSVSVHGLGPEATLILVNGHRVANYPIGAGGTLAFVDLGTIPLPAVERVEVLKDGASAIYGADAVAGVINIRLRTAVDGTTISLGYRNTTSKDAGEYAAGIVQGVSRGNFSLTVAVNYSRRAAIFNTDRAYSATPPFLSTNSSPINLQLTRAAYDEAVGLPPGTPPPGVPATRAVFFATPGVTPGATGGNTLALDGNVVSGGTNLGLTPANQYLYSPGPRSRFNFNQFAGSLPEKERRGVSLVGDCRLGDRSDWRAGFEAILQSNFTENVLAPAATSFFTSLGNVELVIPARTPNPLPLPDGRARAAPAGAYNPFNPFNQDLAGTTRYRLAEFGNRVMDETNDAALLTAGLRKESPPDQWSLDLGLRYSRINNRTAYTMVSRSRLNRIMNQADPIFNPASPEFIGTTTAYNPFGYYGNPIASNQAAVAYATVHEHDRATSDLTNGFLAVSRPEFWPGPAGAVGLAAGIDFRRETVGQSPDPFYLNGDIVGGGAAIVAHAAREVLAAYAEVRLPVFSSARNIPGAHSLTLNLAGRIESFLTSHQSKGLPKVALRWQPAGDALTVRASYGTGIRQPSLFELNNSSQAGPAELQDPRNATTNVAVNAIIRSNAGLRPETTSAASAGFVWTAGLGRSRLTLAVDGWRVVRDGTVTVSLQNTLNRYYGTAPGGIQPGESVVLDAAGEPALVTSLYLNAGRTEATGIDFTGSWLIPTAAWGRFELSVAGSRLLSMRISTLPGLPPVEMLNQDASNGSALDGYLRWKGRTGVTWSRKRLSLGLTGRFTDGFQDVDLNGNNFQVASTWTWDAQAAYEWTGSPHRWLRHTKLTAGAINVLDRRPPTAYGGGGSPVGYPGFLYTAEGRMIYVSLEKKY